MTEMADGDDPEQTLRDAMAGLTQTAGGGLGSRADRADVVVRFVELNAPDVWMVWPAGRETAHVHAWTLAEGIARLARCGQASGGGSSSAPLIVPSEDALVHRVIVDGWGQREDSPIAESLARRAVSAVLAGLRGEPYGRRADEAPDDPDGE